MGSFLLYSGAVTLFVWIFGLIVLVLWIMLPFIVYGIKKRLDTMLKYLDDIEDSLETLPTYLDRIARSIDPDGSRYKSSLAIQAETVKNEAEEAQRQWELNNTTKAFFRDQGGSFELVGITKTGTGKAQWFIEFRSKGKTFMKKLGDTINGWTITNVTESCATLTKGSLSVDLT